MGESTVRFVFAAGLALVALVVGGLIGRSTPAPSSIGPQVDTTEEREDQDTRETITVHVSGMVVAPGVVHVESDAIVADAIDAAGGLRAGAMVDQVNLAAPVSDGDQIIVPGGATEPAPGTQAGDGVLSLNHATASELESLPGVGPVLAERIVSFREESGGFEAVEDLLQVPGIGEAKLDAIRDLVRP